MNQSRQNTGSRKRDFSECACSGKNLSKLVQPSILAILADAPAHGYAITERISEQYTFLTDAPKHSGIYRVLRRMEAAGLLESRLEETPAGPSRRVYSITADGETCLERWIESLTQYKHAIESFLKLEKGRR